MILTKSQVQQFDEQGFVVLESLFTVAQVKAVREAALEIVDNFDIDQHRTVFSTSDNDSGRDDYFFDSSEAVHCFLEEGALDADGSLNRPKELAINKIGHAMHDLIPDFGNFCRRPEIGELLREIGYDTPSCWQTMYIFKQPDIGGEVRWHQDASYLIAEPACVTGMWIALEDSNLNNGCLWVQPGQHRKPLREIYTVDWEKRAGTLTPLDDTPWKTGSPLPLEVPVGSVVLFNDHMPHYSAQNRSPLSRHAFTIHVAEKNAKWSDKNWLQRPNLGSFDL